MDAEVPAGLRILLDVGDLPAVGLTAAAGHPDLLGCMVDRARQPAGVIVRAFAPGRLPDVHVAVRLVERRLPQAAVAHMVGPAEEHRPEVLRALVRFNVPAARPRRRLLQDATGNPKLAAAILYNRRWPVAEQLELLHGAEGQDVLPWLARLDPDVEVGWAQVLGERAGAAGADAAHGETPVATGTVERRPLPWRLDSHPVVALHALLRRPWLAEVPLALAGSGLRSAIATVSADERTLYRLLGTAQRLASHGRSDRAAQIIEAVACNPSAPLGVQRRAKRLARRIDCPYLDGWRPTVGVDVPLWEAPPAQQSRVMDRLEQLAGVRHRTVWSAALLARNPALAPEVTDRLVRYLDDHLHAVDEDGTIAALVAGWLGVSPRTARRWEQRRRDPERTRRGQRPRPHGGQRSAGLRRPLHLHLDDCRDEELARIAARELAGKLGGDPDSWEVAWLLLREGWDLPLHDLPAIVHQLHPTETDHAA